MTDVRIEEIRARHNRATPGPWMWDVRSGGGWNDAKIVTNHSGQYYVMGFERWGMRGAIPRFQEYERYEGPVDKRGSRGMQRADKFIRSYPGKEHHDGFDDYFDHPDADLIVKAPEDIAYLLSVIDKLMEGNTYV